MEIKKYLLLLIFLFPAALLFAQNETQRTLITIKISVPSGEDAADISIYNKTTLKGTVTNGAGVAFIEVAKEDLLQITAVQFSSFTVKIDAQVIEDKNLLINLNPVVNQLGEVVIDRYDLKGSLDVDVNRVNTIVIASSGFDFSYKALEFDYDFQQDAESAIIGNRAEEAMGTELMKDGLNIKNLIGLLFSDKKKSKQEIFEEKLKIRNWLRRYIEAHNLFETLQIPADKREVFLFFVEDTGVETELLKPENEILLLEFLFQKSNEFKQE